MSKFSMDDYVDVAERIRVFYERFPEGSLQSDVRFVDGGVLAVAWAYRSPEDGLPGTGHAFEPIPGRTPYTKDSEVQNAETSAWGRAIVSLGFETKKIASRQEVQARQSAGEPSAGNGAASGTDASPAEPSSFKAPTGPRGGEKGKAATERLRAELKELVTQLGATDALESVNKHADEGDDAWLRRQIKTAKAAVKDKEALPF